MSKIKISKQIMNTRIIFLVVFNVMCSQVFCAAKSEVDNQKNKSSWTIEFEENFTKAPNEVEPENLFILDGEFLVKTIEDNKLLELSGSPVGDFGFLFGPRVKEKAIELQFSFYSSKQGRRFPAIAAGIGGIRGYRFRWNASSQKILLYRDDVLLIEKVQGWESSSWWQIRFQILPLQTGKNLIRLKLWQKEKEEPQHWLLEHRDQLLFKGGKCVLWAFPYSGMPIQFDDLKILSF